MSTETLPVFRKGGTYYAMTPDMIARPLLYRTIHQRTYRNSRPALPEGLPYGRYLGKPSKVDSSELEWRGVAEFVTEKGLTRIASEIKVP